MASPPPPAPQPSPRPPEAIVEYRRMPPVTTTCNAADQARLWPQRSCSKKISALAAMAFERLRDDAHVADTGLLHRIHHGGEGAERHVFIGADEDGLVLRVTDFLTQPGSDFIDVDSIVAQKDALLLVDADYQALLGDLFYGARFWDIDFNARLQHWRRDHEDDQEHEDDVHQGRDVDIGERGLSAPVDSRESHYRRTSPASAVR